MENQTAPKAPPSRAKKLIIITTFTLGIISVLAIITAVIYNSKSYSNDVSILAAQQSETIRVASIGVDHDNATPTIRNYAISVQTSVISANQRLRSVSGGVPSQTIQALYTDSSLDSTLEKSASINKFNQKFLEIIEKQLTAVVNQANLVILKIADEDALAIAVSVSEETQLLLDELP